MPQLTLYLLGSPVIEQEGIPIEVDTRKAIALLAYLAMSGKRHSRDALATLLWPDYNQSNARAALRRTLSALRKGLKQEYLEMTRESISIIPGIELWLDVSKFRQLLAACSTHGHKPSEVCLACLPLITEAVKLYRDDFLAGFTLRDSPNFDEWQFFESENLRRELAIALEKLVLGYCRQRDFESAILYARRWLAQDPLHEEAHRQLMQLYAWSGQRNAALRQYRECVRTLEQELGVPPLEETTQLYQAILENRTPLPPDEMQPESGSVNLPSQLSSAEGKPRVTGYPLVGRALPWLALLQAYDRYSASGYFFVLDGEAGIGKTRLAEEFLSHIQKEGAAVITARGYEGEASLAYGPFAGGLSAVLAQPDKLNRLRELPAHWLVEAARLLPDLIPLLPSRSSELMPALPAEGPGAQSRFFEGLRQVLSKVLQAASPGVLFLDDLHWADAASIDLLIYLVRRLRGTPLFILATWQSEALTREHKLMQLAAEVQRSSAGQLLKLSHLTPDDIAELVHSTALQRAGQREFSERLFRKTEGLPFFVVEYLESLAMGAGLNTAEDWAIPHSVRDLLHSRLAAIDETGWQLLTTAAAIGRSFDFNTLREASGRSEIETVAGLEALLERGLVQEQKTSSSTAEIHYDFTYDMLRHLVYEETSLTRRRLLHRRVAEALVALSHSTREGGALASQIGYHSKLAGQDQQAAEYYRLAGERARKIHANVEAIAHFQAALAAGHPAVAELHESIGDSRTLSGEYSAALTSYETAAALCSPQDLPRIEHKLGDLHHRRGEWELAESHYRAALDELGDRAAPAKRARLYADWSRTAHSQCQLERALDLAGQALQLAEAAGEPAALAQAHNILGILARNKDDLTGAEAHLLHSLEIAVAENDPFTRIAALNNLALLYAERANVARAIEFAQEALELCTALGDRHHEAALNNNLADLFHETGQTETAMNHLKKAVVIFAEIGVEVESNQAEIWMLTEW